MKRWLVALAVASCSHKPPAPDAALVEDAPSGNTFGVPIGAACSADDAPDCANGAGRCTDGVCRAFCAVLTSPRCPDGTMEAHSMDPANGGADICVCVPD